MPQPATRRRQRGAPTPADTLKPVQMSAAPNATKVSNRNISAGRLPIVEEAIAKLHIERAIMTPAANAARNPLPPTASARRTQ